MPADKRKLKFIFLICLGFPCLFVLFFLLGSGFLWSDIYGVVVDEDGKPLDNVELLISYRVEPSVIQGVLGGHDPFNDPYWNSRSDLEKKIVSGKFRVPVKRLFKGGRVDTLSFNKEGYIREGYNSRTNSNWRGMRVVLRRPPPEPPRVREIKRLELGRLEYSLRMQRRSRILLPKIDRKEWNLGDMMLPFDRPFGADWNYLELDFKRDERGGIVFREFPGVLNSKGETVKYPAAFVIRLLSDDPDDGMIPVGEGESLAERTHYDGVHWTTHPPEYQQIFEDGKTARSRLMDDLTVAPEDGYTRREIEIPVEEMVRIWNRVVYAGSPPVQEASWYPAYRCALIRVGGRYGKFFLHFAGSRPERVDYFGNGEEFGISFDCEVCLNPRVGNRNLTEYGGTVRRRDSSRPQPEDKWNRRSRR
jgi:hypothetical protein